jgi:hypothetical protein
MTRAALEHLLRAAAAITNERDFVVIGRQAVLGRFPHAPEALLASIEADLYPRDASDRSDLVDAAIGPSPSVALATMSPELGTRKTGARSLEPGKEPPWSR